MKSLPPLPRLTHLLVALAISVAIGTSVSSTASSAEAPLSASQSPNSSSTPPAVVGVVPENGRWIMKLLAEDPALAGATASAPAAGSGPSAAGSTVLVTELKYSKTGATWRVQTQIQGKDVEYWRVGQLLIEPVAGSRLPLVLPTMSATSSQPCYSKGFYGLSWIKPDRYTGKADYKGTDCYHYKGGIPKNATSATAAASPNASPAEAAAEASPIPPEAWIDTKTLLPVAARFNGTILEYTFESAPTTALILPATYQEAWNLYQEQQARLKSLMMP